jgi:hypothetical protein
VGLGHFLRGRWRTLTMSEEKKERWLNWLALTTVIFSGAATLASFKGSGYGSNAMMAQNLASDQWAFYQAKSIKQNTYEMQREALSLEVLHAPEPVQAKYRETIERYGKEAERYNTEKADIERKARAHEKTKADSQRYAENFGIAVLYLQVSIILSALSALLKKPYLWGFGIFPGLVGLLYFVNGFFLFF